MVASTTSSNTFIAQSGNSQNNSSKSKSLTNKPANENQFVKKMEKSSSTFGFDKSYKIEIAEDKLPKTFSSLHEGVPWKKEEEEDKTDTTLMEVNTEKKNEVAEKSKSQINKTTFNSAVKLYTILKGDILIENDYKFETGPVDFYV